MKVLFQEISRYQDSAPTTALVEVEGNLQDNLAAILVMAGYCPNLDDANECIQYYKGDNIIVKDDCVCLWGEEVDVIITVVG